MTAEVKNAGLLAQMQVMLLPKGFTLIEVIVGGMVFLFIVTALATVFQVGMVVDQDEQSYNEIITAIMVGRRLLLEGAPRDSNVGDKGLLEAQMATMTEALEELDEYVDTDPLSGLPKPIFEYEAGFERYRLWIDAESKILLRHRIVPSVLPSEAILGHKETNLKVTTLDGNEPFENSRLPGFVSLSLLVFEDRNGDDLPDLEEPAVPFQLSVALRNAIPVP